LIGLFIVQQEVWSLYGTLVYRIENGYLNAPDFVKEIPGIGDWIKNWLYQINRNPQDSLKAIETWLQSNLAYSRQVLNLITTNMVKFSIAIMALFFFLRDGSSILSQIKQATFLVLGERVNGYFQAVGVTTYAVVYGIGLTAVAQGVLAGIGYFVVGAPNPVLLMMGTMVVALIPFGTPFAWGSVVIYLMSIGETGGALALLLWGVLVISWIDNLIRPIVISGATKIPFLIIFIGVLGGLSAFGFIGIFVGPVVLAVATAVWREWISRQKVEINTDPKPLGRQPDTLMVSESINSRLSEQQSENTGSEVFDTDDLDDDDLDDEIDNHEGDDQQSDDQNNPPASKPNRPADPDRS
jgi:predicted PurR-regulated permease PerM